MRSLPDAAGILRHHRLSDPAAERLAELREVLHAAVDAPLARAVRIRLGAYAGGRLAHVFAPDLGEADEETRYYVEKTLRDFRLAGVDKDEATRQRITALRDELVKVGQDFSRNIRHDLRSRGLEADEIDAALATLEPEGTRAAGIVLRRGSGPRTARYLAARGFAEEACESALERGFATDP